MEIVQTYFPLNFFRALIVLTVDALASVVSGQRAELELSGALLAAVCERALDAMKAGLEVGCKID